jgi:SH2 domain
MDHGEGIVHPSSKGTDHLTVTWKVADDIYRHDDVREEGKENAFSLGKSLRFHGQVFDPNTLLCWFKYHFRHPIPGMTFSRTPI